MGVPVGLAVPDTVVVAGRAVTALLFEDPTVGIAEEAPIKIIEEDIVIVVAL
jgi:hypothetical protein